MRKVPSHSERNTRLLQNVLKLPVESLAMETFTEYEIFPSCHIPLNISSLFRTSSIGLGCEIKEDDERLREMKVL